MQINLTGKISLILFIILYLASAAQAENVSILIAPSNLGIYKKDPKTLSDREKWQIKIHGLRTAPLDPLIWGTRRLDRTENRRLIPIKPFYLRASEASDFRIKSISFDFKFQGVDDRTAEKNAHAKDSVLDFGFAGHFQAGAPMQRPEVDSSYVLRLSAFAPLPAGLYFRSHSKHEPIAPSDLTIRPGNSYKFRAEFSADKMISFIDDKKFIETDVPGVNKGLIYLITSWNPVSIQNFEIQAEKTGSDNQSENIILNGVLERVG